MQQASRSRDEQIETIFSAHEMKLTSCEETKKIDISKKLARLHSLNTHEYERESLQKNDDLLVI